MKVWGRYKGQLIKMEISQPNPLNGGCSWIRVGDRRFRPTDPMVQPIDPGREKFELDNGTQCQLIPSKMNFDECP